MIFVGFVIMGGGFILLSQVNSLWMFYAAIVVIATGAGLGGFIAAMATVNYWFAERRSTAMSIVMAGSSLGGLLVSVMAWGIEVKGWSTVAMGIGVVLLAAALPLSRILKLPSQRLQTNTAVAEADQIRDSSVATRAEKPPEDRTQDFTTKQALRTRAFWLITLSHTLANMSIVAISVHGVLHLTDIGLSLSLAGAVVATYMAVSLVAQLVGGYMGDRMNKRYVIFVLMCLQGVAMLVFAVTVSAPLAFLFAVIYGIGFGGRTPVLHSLRGEYFGRKSFGTILGMSNVVMNIGMLISPVVLGYLFDVQHTYRYGMLGLGFIAMAGGVMALFATRPRLPTPAGVKLSP
jgi:MFS family permease